MEGLYFVSVTDGVNVILFPAGRIDCVLRTDREDRDDIVRIINDGEIYSCWDEEGTGRFENSIIKFVVEDDE